MKRGDEGEDHNNFEDSPTSTDFAGANYYAGKGWTPPRKAKRAWKSRDRIPGKPTTPFDIDAFERLLRLHPNRPLVEFALTGLREGFDNNTELDEEFVTASPLKTAFENPGEVTKWLSTEAQRGHVFEFDTLPHEFARLCSVGLVTKKAGADGVPKWRFISHLSKAGPNGEASVNSGISEDDYSMEMLAFWSVIELMVGLGPDCHWSACDARWGFRQVPLHPDVWHTAVYPWNGKFYVDTRLAFGSRHSPKSYDAITTCIEWIVQQRLDERFETGQAFVRHLIDDFVLPSKTLAISKIATTILEDTMAELKVPLAAEKWQRDVTNGVYLGREIDTGTETVANPPDKTDDVIGSLELLRSGHWHNGKRSLRKKELQSVVGKLTWGHAVWPSARPHVNAFLRAINRQPFDGGFCRITPDMREAAAAWISAIGSIPPRPFAQRPAMLAAQTPQIGLSMPFACGDASGSIGYGWFTRTHVAYRRWKPSERAASETCTGVDLEGNSNSSTLQELRCCQDAVNYWVQNRPRGSPTTFTYIGDADNLRALFKRGRSPKDGINDVMMQIGELLGPAGLAVRIVWHSRDSLWGVAADHLSRCSLPAFQELLPDHPAILVKRN